MLPHRNSDLLLANAVFTALFLTEPEFPLWLEDAMQSWEHSNLMCEVRFKAGALPSELEQ